MTVLDDVKQLLMRYAGASTQHDDAVAHFQQVAQSVDTTTLASGIAAAMRSNDTPAFPQMVSQLFSAGSSEQQSGMLNALMSALSPEQLAQIPALIPGLNPAALAMGTTPASAISPDTVQQLAAHIEQRNPGIVDRMSAFYADHPGLVKTLGSAALVIAMRKIAERRA